MAFDAARLKLRKKKIEYQFESAKFVLAEINESTLSALKRESRDNGSSDDLERVRVATEVISRFIRRHGDDGVTALEKEQKRSMQAHVAALPTLHLVELRRRIETYGMSPGLLEKLEPQAKLGEVPEKGSILRDDAMEGENTMKEESKLRRKRAIRRRITYEGAHYDRRAYYKGRAR